MLVGSWWCFCLYGLGCGLRWCVFLVCFCRCIWGYCLVLELGAVEMMVGVVVVLGWVCLDCYDGLWSLSTMCGSMVAMMSLTCVAL